MGGFDLTDLQGADYAVGKLIADCYAAMSPDHGPAAFRSFMARRTRDKIYYCRNDDVQGVLSRIARHETEPSTAVTPDLPAIVYYRAFDLASDMTSRPTVFEARRFDTGAEPDADTGLLTGIEATCIPVQLAYSLLVLAWDRLTAERMALAWWGYTAPLFREHSRIVIPYVVDGETLEVPGSIDIPREFASSAETLDDGRRLFGMKTSVNLNTQVVYGRAFTLPPEFTAVGVIDDTDVRAGGVR